MVHDGGVGKDPPRRQKRLPFKSAPATWLEATRVSGCDAEAEWKALPSEEQRAIKAVADAAAKHEENVAKSEAKAAKRAAQQAQKAVAAGTTAKSARDGGYRVACAKCPASWQEGVVNREDLWAKLGVAEQKAVVAAAKGKPARGKPRKPSPSFRTEHKDLDEHGLEAAWAALGVPGHKRWWNDHPVRGLARKTLIVKRSSVGKRRAQVPKVFRTAHAGENVALVGKKWADMGKEQQRAWLRNQRLQQSAETHRQARTVALPCAAGGASSRAQPHTCDHRVSRVRYAALQKFPELELKYTEEDWDAMAGGFQRRVISAEKERLSANKENVTVQDLWARSKTKRDRKKNISKLTKRIYRRAFGMRSVGLVHKFGGPAVRNVDAAREQYHARRERSTQKHCKADHPVSYVRGEVPASLQASSLTYVFPPSDLLERRDAPGSRASRPKVAVLRAAAPVAMHVNITEQQKLKAVQHLCKDLPAEALQRIGLERTGEQSAVTRIQEYDLERVRSVLDTTSKQRRRPKNYARSTQAARGVFGDLASIAQRTSPSSSKKFPWGCRRG